MPTGSETVLRCEASGDPPLTVHWRRLDQLVDEMDRFQLTMTPSGQSQFLDLNISRVEAEDGGVYICQAANIYGNDATEIRLIVQGNFLNFIQIKIELEFELPPGKLLHILLI